MAAASTAVKRKRGKADQGRRLERRHRAQSIIQSKALDELETEVETGLYENVDLSPPPTLLSSLFPSFPPSLPPSRLPLVECV